MLNFIILDDDPIHNKRIEKGLISIIRKYMLDASVSLCTTSPMKVIEYSSRYKLQNNVYLLDVNIQSHITGIDVANVIREYDKKAYIVFISAHPEYVFSSLKAKIFDYLIKPVDLEIFENCIKKLNEDFNKTINNTSKKLLIKSGYSFYIIEMNEIMFLEKFGHILVIHTTYSRIECSKSLDSIEQKLDSKCFFRCHKSYIVNIIYISRIDYQDNIIYLKNGEKCIVSRRLKKELKYICSTQCSIWI